MSLIQQALEKQSASVGTALAEKLATIQPLPPEEKKVIDHLEKKIAAIEKKTSKRNWGPWLISLLSAVAFLGGIYWVHTFSNQDGSADLKSTTVIRAPFQPLPMIPRKVDKPAVVLTGITESGGVRYALINNQVVTIGDVIKKDNILVREILPKGVIIERNGRPETLMLD